MIGVMVCALLYAWSAERWVDVAWMTGRRGVYGYMFDAFYYLAVKSITLLAAPILGIWALYSARGVFQRSFATASVVLGLSLWVVNAYLPWHIPLMLDGYRQYWTEQGLDVRSLNEWYQQQQDREGFLEREHWPPLPSRHEPAWVEVRPGYGASITFGGGFAHFGIAVMEPGKNPAVFGKKFIHFEDNVFLWHEMQ
jgi:hypothetical protein